ncbi:MAG: ribosome recycling factor [Flavobacteriales bacterium]|nr:ribosome recycling factor [Flavobacteriales bacterium]
MSDIKFILDHTRELMEKAIEHTRVEFSRLRAGKAMPSLLDGVMVEYYGSTVPLNQVANVNTPDARTLSVQPWEKTLIPDIERAILQANLGLNPQNDGTVIMIAIPILTEERRAGLVKQVKTEAEKSKISIRNIRKDAIEDIKKLQKDGLSEDLARDGEEEVQKIVNLYTKKIDDLIVEKEKDIMTV